MESKRAFVFPCTKNYLGEAKVMVYSLRKWHPEIPVFVTLSDDMDGSEFQSVGGVEVIRSPQCDTEFRQVRTHRFKVAAELGEKGFTSVCLLDADMCLVYKIPQFFKMAESGVILVCSDNTVLRYETKHLRRHYLEVADGFDVIHTGFSTVPTFINPQIHKDLLEDVWTNPTGNDLETWNLIMLRRGYMDDRVVLLNSYQWTNIHHTMMKPETFTKRTFDMRGEHFISHMGERVYMIHGHWLFDGYCEELMEPMERNYGDYPGAVHTAREALKVIRDVYRRYAKEAGVEVVHNGKHEQPV